MLAVETPVNHLRVSDRMVGATTVEQGAHAHLDWRDRQDAPLHGPVVGRDSTIHRVAQDTDELRLIKVVMNPASAARLPEVVRALDAEASPRWLAGEDVLHDLDPRPGVLGIAEVRGLAPGHVQALRCFKWVT